MVPSAEVWIWKDLAAAASHCRTTWLIVAVPPRSTWIHCGSPKALDQRVPALPSTAADAAKAAFSADEAVAGLPWDSNVVAAPAGSAFMAMAARSVRTAALHSFRASDMAVYLGSWVIQRGTGGLIT